MPLVEFMQLWTSPQAGPPKPPPPKELGNSVEANLDVGWVVGGEDPSTTSPNLGPQKVAFWKGHGIPYFRKNQVGEIS